MSPVSAPPTRGVIAPIRNLIGAIAENTTATGMAFFIMIIFSIIRASPSVVSVRVS